MLARLNIFFLLSLISIFPIPDTYAQTKKFDWLEEIHWDWSRIDYSWNNLYFPKDFRFGVATSHFQIEGSASDTQPIKNNWTESTNINLPKPFLACNHWSMWQEDVELIKQLGITDYRCSIGWDRIQPTKGTYDQDAINHYKELFRELKRNNIEPWICLFHFTLPTWVEESGGFSNEDNVEQFVNFCTKIFNEFHEEVHFWASFNEPLAYVVEAYMTGKFPPHHPQGLFKSIGGFYKAGKALKNMLEAHIRFYQVCKKIDPSAQIGIIHMFHILDPNSSYNPIEKFIAQQGNHLINDSILNFFQYGYFNWKQLIYHTNDLAQKSLDYIGVNYYRHQITRFGIWSKQKNGVIDARNNEQTAHDTGWAIYPEGLYRSIKKAKQLNFPIYVTEIGIADDTSEQRDEFIRKHLYAIQRAREEGCNVLGCFLWSLMDNYEWGCNPRTGPRFGLYQVDFSTFQRSLRPDAQGFVSYLLKQRMQQPIFNKLDRRQHLSENYYA